MKKVLVNPGNTLHVGKARPGPGSEVSLPDDEADRLFRAGIVSAAKGDVVVEPLDVNGGSGLVVFSEVVKSRPDDPEKLKEEISRAMDIVLKEGKHLTQKTGKPEVRAVEVILGYNISAKERDDLMAEKV